MIKQKKAQSFGDVAKSALYRKSVLFAISFVVFVGISWYVYAQQTSTFTVDTVVIFPGHVTANGWDNVDRIRQQNLDEFSLYQEFSSMNSAVPTRTRVHIHDELSSDSEDSSVEESDVLGVESSTSTPASTSTSSYEQGEDEVIVSSDVLEDANSEEQIEEQINQLETESQVEVVETEEETDTASDSDTSAPDEVSENVSAGRNVFRASVAGVFQTASQLFPFASQHTTSTEQEILSNDEDVHDSQTEALEDGGLESEIVEGVEDESVETGVTEEEEVQVSETVLVEDEIGTTSESGDIATSIPESTATSAATTTDSPTSTETVQEPLSESEVDTATSTTDEEVVSEEQEDSMIEEVVEVISDRIPCSETDCRSYTVTMSNFGLPIFDENTEMSGGQLRVSFAAQERGGQRYEQNLSVRYSFDDEETWMSGGAIIIDDEVSNSLNGGYYLFSLPNDLDADMLDNLTVEIIYVGNIDGLRGIYLESAWLEVFTIAEQVEDSVTDGLLFEDNGWTDSFLSGNILDTGEEVIEFDFTDDTSGETLIIKSSGRDFAGLSKARTYFNVTNTSDRADTFELQTYFPEGVGEVVSLKEWNRNKPRRVTVPEIRPFVYHCEAGWVETDPEDTRTLEEVSQDFADSDEVSIEEVEFELQLEIDTETEIQISDTPTTTTSTPTTATTPVPADNDIEDVQGATTDTTFNTATTTSFAPALPFPLAQDSLEEVLTEESVATSSDVDLEDAAESPAFEEELEDEEVISGTFRCGSTNIIRECDSVEGDATACHVHNVKIAEHEMTFYEGGWERREFNQGAKPDPNVFARFVQRLGFGPQTKEVPDTFEVRTHTGREYTIQPGETLYFKMDIEFPPFSTGEWWVEAIGAREYGLLDPFWSSQWEYRKKIEISGTDFTTYQRETQVLIELDDSLSDFWSNVRSDGGDIRFVQQERTPASTWYGINPATISGWYDVGWSSRLPITINASEVDTTLTDFPVYVDLSTLGSDFFNTVRSDGGDIRVTGSDEESEMPVEVVWIDTGAEAGEMHFRADTLSAAEDTTFYIYFGNASSTLPAVTSTYGRNNVWSNGYEAVYHLQETGNGTTGEFIDSTGNGRDATGGGGVPSQTPSATTTFLGTGQFFNITNNQFITNNLTASQLNLGGAGQKSISMWAFTNSMAGGDGPALFQLGSTGTNLQDFSLRTNSATVWRTQLWGSDIDWTYPQAIGQWTHFVQDYDGTTVRNFANGVVESSAARALNTTNAENFRIGRWRNGYWDGVIDEVRVSSVARSAEWYAAEHSNQINSTAFYATSTIEGQPTVTGEIGIWPERIPLTIDADNIDADLTDFVMYVDLATLGSDFFSQVQVDGADIRVTAGDGDTQLAREIVAIDTTTNTGQMYFKADFISSSDDTTFYIYYGNPTADPYAPSDPFGAEAVWTDYEAVWHFADGAGTTAADSSGNGNDGTLVGSPSWTTGPLGTALEFNGAGNSGNRVTVPGFLSGTNDVTVSVWFNQNDLESGNSSWTYVLHSAGGQNIGGGDFWLGRLGNQSNFTGDIGVAFDGTWNPSQTDVELQRNGQFYHVTAVHADDEIRIYVDGELTRTRSQSMFSWSNDDWGIGAAPDGYRSHPGIIDSPRVATVPRSSAWVAAEFANQNDPASFYATSSPQTPQPAPFVELDYWIQHFDYDNQEADIWVQTDLLRAADTSVIEMYYGNADAETTSDRFAPFTYSELTPIYHVVNTDATAPIRVVSLIDENVVQLDGGAEITLNRGEATTFTSYTASSSLSVIGPVASKILQDTAEGLIPVSFAGTEFTVPSTRGNPKTLDLLAPFLDADYEIFFGTSGSPAFTGTISFDEVLNESQNVSNVSTIFTTEPILGFYRSGTNDSLALYPPTTRDLFGIRTNQSYLSTIEDDTSFNLECADGSTTSISGLDRGQQHNNDFCDNGTLGTGEAIRISGQTAPIAAIQQADGSGTESTMFWPEKEWNIEYQIPADTAYIAAVCSARFGTSTIQIINTTGSIIEEADCTTDGNGVGSVVFNGGSGSASSYFAGFRVRSINDTPFFMYAEVTEIDNNETNVTGPVQARKYFDRSAEISFGEQQINQDAQYNQTAFRWYEDTNSLTPSNPWPIGIFFTVQENEPIANEGAVLPGERLRLRMNLEANVNPGLENSTQFRLQYAEAEQCQLVPFSQWQTIGAPTDTDRAFRGFDNSGVTSGDTLTSLLLASSTVAGSYLETTISSLLPNEVAVGEAVEYDWSIEAFAPNPNTTYCFRMVRGTNAPLVSYSEYPRLDTGGPPFAPQQFLPFDNEHESSQFPRFEFQAVDNAANDLHYQIQLAEDPTFSSTIFDRNSINNGNQFEGATNPSDKAPFASGARVAFVGTPSLDNNETYWWRTRARDPGGSDEWGDWSEPFSFTVNTSIELSEWYQNTDEQFSTNQVTNLTIGGDTVSNNTNQVVGEFATANVTNGEISTINLNNTYQNPVVVASVRYDRTDTQRVARVVDKTSTSFDILVDNYDSSVSGNTTVDYFVVEAGDYIIDDGDSGTRLVANTVDSVTQVSARSLPTNPGGSLVTFSPSFSVPPVVFTTVSSQNSSDWVFSSIYSGDDRANSPTANNFRVFLNRNFEPVIPMNESVDYVAIEPTRGSLASGEFESLRTSTAVDSNPTEVSFSTAFPSTPQVTLVQMISSVGVDGGYAMTDTNNPVTTTGHTVTIDEDGPGADRGHSNESTGHLIFEAATGNVETAIPSGVMRGTEVSFESGQNGNVWGEFAWDDAQTDGEIRYQLEYRVGLTWQLIPESDLPGNEDGFTSSPIDLIGLDPLVYSNIRPVARFDGEDVTLNNWRITWGERVGTPVQLSPFNHEKVATTSPLFRFVSEDPQGGDLEYEFSIADNRDFTSSTTYNSASDTVFTNLDDPGDSHPFTENETIGVALPAALVVGETYFWRVRAKDPNGSDTFTPWSQPSALTIDSAVDRSTWFQGVSDQFREGELLGTQATDSDIVTVSNVIGEYGQIVINNNDWTLVELDNDFSNPVVVTSERYFRSTDTQRTSRIRNKTSNSFEVLATNWDNSVTGTTTIDWIVMEAGDWLLEDGGSGLRVVADTELVSHVQSGTSISGLNPDQVEFDPPFADNPAVLATVSSVNSSNMIYAAINDGSTTRQNSPSASSLGLYLQKGQVVGTHPPEDVDYIAFAQGAGVNNGAEFETILTSADVTHNPTAVPFSSSFSSIPQVAVVQQSSHNGAQLSYLMSDLDNPTTVDDHTVSIDEDGPSAARTHATEQVSLAVFQDAAGTLLRSQAAAGGLDGIFRSSPITFSDGAGPRFEEFMWNDTVSGAANISYQVEFQDASGVWDLIPDTAIPDNSVGTTTSPISLVNVDPETYFTIRVVANLECDSSTCPELEDWTVTWADGFNVSGILRESDRSTAVATGTVRVAVNGNLLPSVGEVSSNGTWTVPGVTAFADDVLTIYVDTATSSARAANVLVYDGFGDITGVQLFEQHLTMSSNENTVVTNSNMAQFDNSVAGTDAVFFNVDASNNLSVCAVAGCEDFILFVGPGNTYQPAPTGTVSTDVPKDFVNRGNVTLNSNTLRVGGSWDDAGTINVNQSTVIFTATSTEETINNAFGILFFHNLTFGEGSGTASWEPQNAFTVTGNLSVNHGTLLRERANNISLGGSLSTGANGFWEGVGTTTMTGSNTVTWGDANPVSQNVGTINLAGNGKTVNVTSDVKATNIVINTNNTLRGGSSNSIQVAGNWTNNGTFVAQTSEVRFIDDASGFRGLATAQAWFDGAWDSRVEITISASSISDTLSDFPVYLDLSLMPADFWSSVADDGADIRITGGDGTTQVPVEVVSIATSTETGEIHFRASALSATNDTTFYVYFNNDAAVMPAVDSAFGRNNVWTNGYEAVFHLNQTATGAIGEFIDSTGNGHDARGGDGNVSQLPSTVAGQLGTAQNFDGGNYFIQAPVAASGLNMGGATAKTVTAWARINTGGNTGGIVGLGTAGPTAGTDYTLRRNGGTNGWRAQHWGGGDHDFTFGSAGVWAYYALDYDGAVSRVFANGNVVSNNTTSLNTGDGFQATIGVWRNANWFDGAVDEVRFASTNRAQAWYQAEFLNQSNPGSFMTVDAEVEVVQILEAEFPSHIVTTGGASFYDLAIDDATTTVSFVDPIITTNRNFIIDDGIVTLPTEQLNVGGSFLNNAGIFAHNNSEVRMTGSATNNQIIQGFSGFLNEFYDLRFTGTGQWAFQDAEHVVRNDLTITNGTPIFPSGELRVVGDMAVSGNGGFNANNGTVVFASGSVNTVTTNGSEFYDVRVTTDVSSATGWLGAGTASDWYDASWQRRLPITVSASAIDAMLTDFPVKVDLDLLGSDFFSQVRSNGGDIRVTAGDGTTELPVEVVFIDTGNETGEIHFRADELSASSDTTFYIYFSNPTANLYAATAPFGRNAVWNNGFEAVYHLNSTLDSSGNGRDLVALSTPTPLGSAYEFDGNLDRLRLPSNFGLFTGAEDFTVSLNFNTNTVAPSTAFGTSPVIYSFRTENNAMLTFGDGEPGDTLGFRYQGWTTPVSTASISTGVDYGVTVTYDASGGGFVMYRDGVSVSSETGAVSIDSGSAQSVLGGVDESDPDRAFDGTIYDFRVASTTRSAAWTRAEYLNWQDSSFLATSTIENVTFSASEWEFRSPITIPSSAVGETLSNFPVYVDLADLGSSFFNNVNSDGGDIRITADDGVTELPYELIAISTTTEAGQLYFLAPTLSDISDTTFFIYYGNELADAYLPDDPLGSEAVWADYEAVWHFADGAGTTAVDSTGNSNDGTLVGSPTWTTGKLGTALEFNGNGDSGNRVTVPAFLSGTTELTVSTWFSQDGAQSGAGGWTYIMHSSNNTSVGSADFWLGRLGSPDPEQGTIGTTFGNWSSGLGHTGVTLENDNRYYHVMAVHSDNQVRIYVDGVLERTRTQSLYNYTNRAWGIGAGTSGYRSHPGIIDSPRITTVPRSSAWVAAEFANQNDPSSFYTLTMAEQFGTRDFVDANVTVARNFLIEAGTAVLPSNTLSVGGSYTNQATMNTREGTVRMSGQSTGTHSVNPGDQNFHNFQIDTQNGTLDLIIDFTVDNEFTVTSANNVILATSTTLTVADTFFNSSDGIGTTWNGTLRFTSGEDQIINAKTNAGDEYGTFAIENGATISMWNSTINEVLNDADSAVYSQNNAGEVGDLYIYGDYVRDTGVEYWQHDVDFDGTSLTSTPRAVQVRVASSSSVRIDGASLSILGTSTASTSIDAISGEFTFILNTAELSGQYFSVAGTDSDGMQWLASTTVSQLEDGLFDVTTGGFSGISIDETTIDTNATAEFERIGFTTIEPIDAFNVTRLGPLPSSFVVFRNGFGNLYGEAFDNNDADPGAIRFDDSSITIAISGTVYADAGVTPLGSPVCDGVTDVVRVVVDGGIFTDSIPCATDGTYSFGAVSFTGDPDILVYLDTDGGAKGTVVTRTPLVDITDLDIYQDRVIVRHESPQPMRIDRMNQFDTTDDSDIGFVVAGNTLEVLPGNELFVFANKTFTPNGEVTLVGGGQSNDYDGTLALGEEAVFNAFATSTLSIGGRLVIGTDAQFNAASTTALFTASTTGKSITSDNEVVFNDITFSGVGGGWHLGADILVLGDMLVDEGIVTGTGDITIPTGSLTGNGILSLGGGLVTLGTTNTITGSSPWTFYDIQFGSGSAVGTTTLARATTTTIANTLSIAMAHHVDLGASSLDFSGDGVVYSSLGSIDTGLSTIRYSGTASNVASLPYYNLVLDVGFGSGVYTAPAAGLLINNDVTIGGTGTSTFAVGANNANITVSGDVLINTNGVFDASSSADLVPEGNWTDNGTFTANNGTVQFSPTVSSIINAGTSPFAHVVIDTLGDVTVARHATATASFILDSHDTFTVASGQTLAVGDNFQNTLGGANTVWTGSTLRLFGGAYEINASTTSDVYNVLEIVDGAQIRTWNSEANTYAVASGASLYSQNHENMAGELYIFGDYENQTFADHWSYNRDWDGTDISAAPRQAQVFIQGGGSATWAGGNLTVDGSTATTTVEAFGAGQFDMEFTSGGEVTVNRMRVRDISEPGIQFTGTPTVNDFSRTDLLLEIQDGYTMTVEGSAIDTNPSRNFVENIFNADSGLTDPRNVRAIAPSVSAWRFTNHGGNIDGEDFDDDDGGDPGYIVWDNSTPVIGISGRVYQSDTSTVSSVCDGTTNNIRLAVDGVVPIGGSTSCDASTGQFTFSAVNFSANDTLTVFISGETERAVTVSKDPISTISNMDLYENHVIARHESTDPLTIADMAVYDSGNDSDVLFTTSLGAPNTLTVAANTKVIVWTNRTFAPGGEVTITGGGGGDVTGGSLELLGGAELQLSGTEFVSIGSNLEVASTATLDLAPATELRFTSSETGRSISLNEQTVGGLTFTGSGSWTVADSVLTTTGDVLVDNGSFTLPTATSTLGGGLVADGGTIVTGTSPLVFTATTTGNSIELGGATAESILFTGTGSWTLDDTNLSVADDVVILDGEVTLTDGQLTVGGVFDNQGGVINPNTSELILTSNTTSFVRASSSDLYALTIAGSGDITVVDENITFLSDVVVSDGSLTVATGTTAVGGSFDATGGVFNNATGTILFNATTGSNTINSGSNDFYNVVIGATGGTYTMFSATTTNDFALINANNFTFEDGETLVVNGVFTNLVGGAATDWTGSTIILDGENSYTINTKDTNPEVYSTLEIRGDSQIRMWNSQAAVFIDSSSSLYSQNNSGNNGELAIYGDFVVASSTEYWSYNRDFDGAFLSTGNERAVTVRHTNNSTTTVTSLGELRIIGDETATTTVTSFSGRYNLIVEGGTFSAEHFNFRNLSASGLQFSNTPNIQTLQDGSFELADAGGRLITVTNQALTANPSKLFDRVEFTDPGSLGGFNVELIGETTAAWRFRNGFGNLYGEAFDIDGADDCGSIRWDDSACLLSQQSQVRWRNDDGGVGAPNSEWFDLDWGNRLQIRLDYPGPVTASGAVVPILLPHQTDMDADFADLRFTSENGQTVIPHWIERFTSNDEVLVWVEVPTLDANEVTSIYMYYNNTSASNTSNASAVFNFSEDFESASLSAYSGQTTLFAVDTSLAYGGSYGLIANPVTGRTNTGGIYRTDVSIGQGNIIRYRQYLDITDGSNDEVCTKFAVQSPGTNNENYAVCIQQFGTDRISIVRDVVDSEGSGTILASTPVTFNDGWYEILIDWQANDSINVTLIDPDGDVATTTSATDSTYTSGGIGFSHWFNHGAWDSLLVYDRYANRPDVYIGGPQEAGGANWSAAQNTPTGGFEPTDIARLRVGIENRGLDLLEQEFRLEYATLGSANVCSAVPLTSFAPVPNQASCGSSPVCMATSSNVTNGAEIGDLLGGALGDYTTGRMVTDPSNITDEIDLNQNFYTEVEYAVTPTLAAEDTLCFIVTNNGTRLDFYEVIAELQFQFDPIVGAVSLNEGLPIVLTPGTTASIVATTTVTDFNGFADIANATTTFFRSGVPGGANCTPDDNNCYITSVDEGTCSLVNCEDDTCELQCTADIWFHADPTDQGSFDGQDWFAFVEAVDFNGGFDFETSMGVDLLTLSAIDVLNEIDFDELDPGTNTGSFNPVTTIVNIGNVALLPEVEGTDMTDGNSSVIPADRQRFATSTFTYSSCVVCSVLSDTVPVPLGTTLTKPFSSDVPIDVDVYWGIEVPFSVTPAPHQGANIFYATW